MLVNVFIDQFQEYTGTQGDHWLAFFPLYDFRRDPASDI